MRWLDPFCKGSAGCGVPSMCYGDEGVRIYGAAGCRFLVERIGLSKG